jgi:hypothetical protein
VAGDGTRLNGAVDGLRCDRKSHHLFISMKVTVTLSLFNERDHRIPLFLRVVFFSTLLLGPICSFSESGNKRKMNSSIIIKTHIRVF